MRSPPASLRERRFGPFHRQVALTGEVNFDAAQAEARNGVLKIRLPKREGRPAPDDPGAGQLVTRTLAGPPLFDLRGGGNSTH